ncbi:MAG TPA: hypothetical protein VK361_08650 [Rubrobacteraceae bacterium]|nr:hypothetical protein [Rubrobacteraceae bacterium]
MLWPEQPMPPVDAAHVYGHVLLAAPAAHDPADHASPLGDRVAIAYPYLDADARFFGAQRSPFLPSWTPWSQSKARGRASLKQCHRQQGVTQL